MKNNQKIGTVGQGLVGSLTEMKKWEESTDQEKIERLRNVLANNKYLVNRIVELEQKVHRLALHTHDASGETVIRMERVQNTGFGAASQSFNPLA